MSRSGDKDAKETELMAILRQAGSEEAILHAFYKACLPMIRKVAVKYSRLDPATSFEDLENQGYLAVVETFLKYKKGPQSMKITSYFYIRHQKCFSELCNGKDRLAVIYYPDGETVTVSYQKFQKAKKRLASGGEAHSHLRNGIV